MYNEWNVYEDAIDLFDSYAEEQREADDFERHAMNVQKKGKREAQISRRKHSNCQKHGHRTIERHLRTKPYNRSDCRLAIEW